MNKALQKHLSFIDRMLSQNTVGMKNMQLKMFKPNVNNAEIEERKYQSI